MTKPQIPLTGIVLCLTLLVIWSTASARDFPVVTGKHWTAATETGKKGFLIGIGTMLEIEKEIQGENPPPNDRSFIPIMVKGLSKYRLMEVKEAIDIYYRNNPDQINRPVIDVIWFELALPNAS